MARKRECSAFISGIHEDRESTIRENPWPNFEGTEKIQFFSKNSIVTGNVIDFFSGVQILAKL